MSGPKKRLTPEETVALLAQQRDQTVPDVTVPEIETDEQYAAVAAAWKKGKALESQIEETRNSIVKPVNDQVKYINDLFKRVGVPLGTRLKALADALGAYDRKKKLAQAEQQRLLNEAAQQQHEDAKKAGIGTPLPVAVAPVLPSETRKIVTDEGTVSMIDNWKVAVTDAAQVPPEYLSPDMKKLQAEVDRGTRAIPGCYIWNEPFPRSGRG